MKPAKIIDMQVISDRVLKVPQSFSIVTGIVI